MTAGGLLFVGRADGRLTALDKSDGHKLWEFQTDAGVNTTVTTFEHHGKQYVVVHAGGGLFANGKRGDGIWMFSLDGTFVAFRRGSARRPGSGGGGIRRVRRRRRRHRARPAPRTSITGRARTGPRVRPATATGEGGEGGGASVVKGQSREAILLVASAERNNMPAFASVYSADELNDIASYIVEVLGKTRAGATPR